ncbi:hypothetical protein [Enterovirga rhinocerotis]|uniref:Uncharacterized protein n=1 Tax=Enterovirga rhinocerotis TaxID=1339210 RepID=A0A4R7BHG5_9HYPH|nr:hypothetical protein [Enterovirga rhinocerotis]TDR84551.1 hypothetical protein EV668_4910 [Enterovirga rhinocerotis]
MRIPVLAALAALLTASMPALAQDPAKPGCADTKSSGAATPQAQGPASGTAPGSSGSTGWTGGTGGSYGGTSPHAPTAASPNPQPPTAQGLDPTKPDKPANC